MVTLKPEDILEGDFWPEPVRVIAVKTLDRAAQQVQAVGLNSKKYYSHVLEEADLERVRLYTGSDQDFGGNAEALFLAVEAHRIRLAYQFDPHFAVSVSQVDPLPHQIEAVYQYMLPNPRIRFLLADDPGAGKTIMTGLLLTELKYRGLVRRTLIVVPGHLKDQWLREMKEKFQESFTIIDRGVVNASWGKNIWTETPQAISSIDFCKQEDVMAGLAEAHWDLVVVDEAHKMAAYRYGEKTTKTERYRLGELLSRTGSFLLFLTATPHRGDPANFRLFLDLLERDFFATDDLLIESVTNRDNPLFLRRLKEDLRDYNKRPLFPPRHVSTNTYTLSDEEKRLYNAVTQYVRDSYNKALSDEKRNVAFAMLILQRRLASSVRAVKSSLERRKQRLEELLRLGTWVAERGDIDEDELEDFEESERLRKEQELVERLTSAQTREELQEEINKLGELIAIAREVERRGMETKLTELQKVVTNLQLKNNDKKLLIFTESRETLEYLTEKFKEWGFTVVALHGGMDLWARIRAEHDFRNKCQIMVSTEAGGEGINLQFCSLMVNYDIPWNPNRLEQRMGRIHRYGQQSEVFIYNLVAVDTLEGKVLNALFRKLERIQDALGSDRVFDVIGEVLRGKSLKDLVVEAVANQRTLDEILGDIEAIPDAEAVELARQAAQEMLASRHIDFRQVLAEERRARENRLVPEYVEQFFQKASAYLDITIRRSDGLIRVDRVPPDVRNVSVEFKNRFGQVLSEYRKIAFDKDKARRSEAEFVAPGHPLLEAVIENVFHRAKDDLRRGAVFEDPSGKLDGWLWFVLGEITDGNGRVAGRRLFAVYAPLQGEMRVMDPAILWNLKPSRGSVEESAPNEQQVVSFAATKVLPEYREEISADRKRRAEIMRKYGLRSLDLRIMESECKLSEYETRRMKGETVPEVDFQNERRHREELEQRRKELELEIQREEGLAASTPQVICTVRVVANQSSEVGHPSPEIEEIGMRVAMEYERQHGRSPEDVSAKCLGYDVVSRGVGDEVRYIEVKARAGTGRVEVTPNEWNMAQRFGDEYWLYVVENAASEPVLHAIKNPAAQLQPREVVEIVRYVIEDWKKGASE
ncbi:MAG: helicase-related protein [Armatimonadota bacterium]